MLGNPNDELSKLPNEARQQSEVESAGSDVGWVIWSISAYSERDQCAHRSRLWQYSLANKVDAGG
jgi:hypothetical protein